VERNTTAKTLADAVSIHEESLDTRDIWLTKREKEPASTIHP